MNHIIENIPTTLRELPQWVMWQLEPNPADPTKPKKMPRQIGGIAASSTDKKTWNTFDAVEDAYQRGGYTGIGFVFAKSDPYCGIDLDGCRDPNTGKVADWAREIILDLDTYSELSPSKTGVKLFVIGSSPFETGKKKELPNEISYGGKNAAIEVYDWGRFFAVTGIRLQGTPDEPQERTAKLQSLAARFWPTPPLPAPSTFASEAAIIQRARKYLSRLPPAVSGSGGHNATFHAACVLCLGFGLASDDAYALLTEYNAACVPPWNERELRHKIDSAMRQPGPRNFLRDQPEQRWHSISVPAYSEPAPRREPKRTTLADASKNYLDSLARGERNLLSTGITELDYAIGGGFEFGEMAIVAACPSHGKSALGLQFAHEWTAQDIPCLFISEEMSALALGKRTLQFTEELSPEHWPTNLEKVNRTIEVYRGTHAPCEVVESAGTIDAVCAEIERAVDESKVRIAILDYAQFLTGPGKGRYEQVSNISTRLKQIGHDKSVLMIVLCQLNREIEKRKKFIPQLSDIRDTGQLGQDADVVIFPVWPWKVDPSQPRELFQFFIAKNRNRAINAAMVEARFVPSRQSINEPSVAERQNYTPDFDAYNRGATEF